MQCLTSSSKNLIQSTNSDSTEGKPGSSLPVVGATHGSLFSSGTRGSVMVEFAIVITMLITLMFALIEGGVMIRNRNQAKNAAEAAVRRAHIVGTSPTADAEILQAINKLGVSGPFVQKVVIFRVKMDDVTDSLESISSDCAAGIADSGKCNVYDASDIGKDAAALNSTRWDPAEREGAPEYIGVLIIARHTSPTGFLPDHTMKAESRMMQARPVT